MFLWLANQNKNKLLFTFSRYRISHGRCQHGCLRPKNPDIRRFGFDPTSKALDEHAWHGKGSSRFCACVLGLVSHVFVFGLGDRSPSHLILRLQCHGQAHPNPFNSIHRFWIGPDGEEHEVLTGTPVPKEKEVCQVTRSLDSFFDCMLL